MPRRRSKPKKKRAARPPSHRRLRSGEARAALLFAAVEEFAAHGVAGTPISRITAVAGARNSSALNYHFGSKRGLVEQLIVLIQSWFDEARNRHLEIMEARVADGNPPTLREALDIFVRPYAKLITEEPWGLAAIRFIATLEFEQHPDGWDLVYKHTSSVAQRLCDLVAAVTGDDPDGSGKRRLLFYFDSVIHGFAAHKHLGVSFFGDVQVPSADKLADFYVQCGERLLTFAASSA